MTDDAHKPCINQGVDPFQHAGIGFCWHLCCDVSYTECVDSTINERTHRQPADLFGDAHAAAHHEGHVARDKADKHILDGTEGDVGLGGRGAGLRLWRHVANLEGELGGIGLGADAIAPPACRKFGLCHIERLVQDGVIRDGIEVARLTLARYLGNPDVA